MATEPNHYIVITTILGQFQNDDVDAVIDEIPRWRANTPLSGARWPGPVSARVSPTFSTLPPTAPRHTSADRSPPLRAGSPSASGSRKERSEDPGEVGVIIYGPKGEELARVVSKAPDGEPEHYEGRIVPLGYRVGDVEWKRGPKPKSRRNRPPHVRAQVF